MTTPPSDTRATDEPVPTAAAGRGSLAWGWRAAWVRLRFLAVLVVAFVVVGRWDALRNHWDKLSRAAFGGVPAEQAVSDDTEYFCPMDPGVVADWPGKCSICNMALVRRKRGEAAPLPDGVVARMQFSPYRLQLAGIRTASVAYRPLAREVEAVGLVQRDERTRDPEAADLAPVLVDAEVSEADIGLLAEGQVASVVAVAFPGRDPFAGTVRALSSTTTGAPGFTARLEVANPHRELRPGMSVVARIVVPIAGLEPFRSLPADPPPLVTVEPRAVYACPDHREVVREKAGRCPTDRNPLERRPLAEDQRLRWWCPMHPDVTADRAGRECERCGGMILLPRVISFRPVGCVLAVDQGAVIDTGSRRLVYVERGPGMFDGVEVALGPRCGDHYPVVRGLEGGERVAVAGSFLIDAESRLNPSLAAGYFGAARGIFTTEIAEHAEKKTRKTRSNKNLKFVFSVDSVISVVKSP